MKLVTYIFQNFNVPLSHRFIQQLEDALNVCLCGHFLIFLAAMCFSAFSVVTVQYNKFWSLYNRKYQFCEL